MRAKKEYSDHFDFNMMKKFNLNFQVRLLNVVVFDTKTRIFFRFDGSFRLKKSRIVRKTNIITSIILMFIFLRKRLLYAYLTEWFKFADLDKINLISTGAKFFRRLLFERSRFLPLKIVIHFFSRFFASKHERVSLPNYQCSVCLKPLKSREYVMFSI